MLMQVVTPVCVVCRNRGQVEVDSLEMAAWRRGAEVQDAFRSLDADQRELLMTGTHAHCWESIHGPELP